MLLWWHKPDLHIYTEVAKHNERFQFEEPAQELTDYSLRHWDVNKSPKLTVLQQGKTRLLWKGSKPCHNSKPVQKGLYHLQCYSTF